MSYMAIIFKHVTQLHIFRDFWKRIYNMMHLLVHNTVSSISSVYRESASSTVSVTKSVTKPEMDFGGLFGRV